MLIVVLIVYVEVYLFVVVMVGDLVYYMGMFMCILL